jgi:hypothetical protein
MTKMTFKIVENDPADFYDLETWIEARRITREQVSNSLVMRWLDAHEHLMQFRRDKENAAADKHEDADRFWYGTKNRIVLGLAVVNAWLHEETPSRSEFARRTAISVQTVINTLNDAQALGFVDDEDRPDERTRKLMRERIIEVVDHQTFAAFAANLTFYRQIDRNEINPHKNKPNV